MSSVLRAGRSLLPACAVAGAAYAYLRNTDTVSVASERLTVPYKRRHSYHLSADCSPPTEVLVSIHRLSLAQLKLTQLPLVGA